jgi:hypothetical protein
LPDQLLIGQQVFRHLLGHLQQAVTIQAPQPAQHCLPGELPFRRLFKQEPSTVHA